MVLAGPEDGMRSWRSFVLTLALVLVLGPAAHAETKERVAVLELSAKSGITQAVADALADLIANTIRDMGGHEVIGKSDIMSMVGFGEVQQKMGCDDTSCLAEIGGALGVGRIVGGNVAQLGDTFLLNLKLIDSKNARVIKGISRTPGNEGELLKAIVPATQELFGADAAVVKPAAVGAGSPAPGETAPAGDAGEVSRVAFTIAVGQKLEVSGVTSRKALRAMRKLGPFCEQELLDPAAAPEGKRKRRARKQRGYHCFKLARYFARDARREPGLGDVAARLIAVACEMGFERACGPKR